MRVEQQNQLLEALKADLNKSPYEGYMSELGPTLAELRFIEVARKGPHPEVRPRQIHGVRAVEDRHFQPFQVPRRSQQLRSSPLIRHTHCC